MATKTLVIDGTDKDHFFLSVEGGTLRVGDAASHPEGVVRDMRILRIHCEVEVEDEREFVPIDEPGVIAPSTLRPDSSVKLAHALLSIAGASAAPTPASFEFAAPVPATPAPAAAPEGDLLQLDLSLSSPDGQAPQSQQTTAVVERRFKVIDGGDQGKAFKLPEEGTVKLGKHGHADIGLHDFYVSKVHCLIHIDGYRILVSHVEGQSGTLIDGVRISVAQKLRPGSILRIGNSHLKLEQGPFDEDPTIKVVEYKAWEPKPEPPPAPPPAPPPPPKRVVAMTVPEPFKELEGGTLGNFKLESILGRGFAGAVFKAENTKTNQTVALKVLASEFPSAGAELEHFALEFKKVQGIRHANLTALQGAGKSGAHFWFAREYVDGESVADVVKRVAGGEKPSWTRAARVAIHLARALEALEEHDLVHGNITPKNVLLAQETRATKLADLRLVEALEGSKLQKSFAAKKRLAELGYLAPEQADPEGFVDKLADLYAIGAVAYALIAGRPPAGEKEDEILAYLKNGRVPRPSSAYKKVPPEFDKIVMKLLAHDQDRRYETATELLEDLEPLSESNDLKL